MSTAEEPEWIRLEDIDPDNIDDEFGDMIIEQRLQVNNKEALERITDDLRLDLPWIETLTVTSKQPLNVPDVFDDLKREEAFYNQALEAVQLAREKKIDVFAIPESFVAPMLKDDEHMKQVYQKLVAEAKEGNEDAVYRLQAFDKQRKKAARVDERQKILSRKRKEIKDEKDLQDELREDEYDLDNMDQEEPEPTGKNKKIKQPRVKYTKDARDAKYSLGKKGKEEKGENPARKGMSIRKKSSLKRPGKTKRQKMRNKN